MYVFEDFEVGRTGTFGGREVTADALADFAESVGFPAGSPAAIRWFAVALQLRMIVDDLLNKSSSQGAPGLEDAQWHADVAVGDVLEVRYQVLERRQGRSRPEIGFVRLQFDTVNRQDAIVLSVRQWMMFGIRTALPAASPDLSTPAPAHYFPPRERGDLVRAEQPWRGWDDPVAGLASDTGSYRFMASDIQAFAQAFDPQPFHVSESAAKRSLFGALCASGLHSVVVCAALADGGPWHEGPKGLKNLRWHRPVFAGERLWYRSVVESVVRSGDCHAIQWVHRKDQGLDSMHRVVLEFEDQVGVRV